MFPIPFNYPFKKSDGTLSTIGSEIAAGGGSYTLPTASDTTKGGVKIGSGLTMTGEVLSNDNPTPYSLPTASAEVLGGIKVGSGLSITDGVLSASGGGGVTPTVDTITLDETTASGSVLKLVKGDDGFIKVSGAINLANAFSSDRVKIATGIPEKYRPGSTNTHWINLKAYVYNSSYTNMHEAHVEIFGNGNVWVYYPDGVSSFTAYHVYISGVYRSDIYNG